MPDQCAADDAGDAGGICAAGFRSAAAQLCVKEVVSPVGPQCIRLIELDAGAIFFRSITLSENPSNVPVGGGRHENCGKTSGYVYVRGGSAVIDHQNRTIVSSCLVCPTTGGLLFTFEKPGR